MLEAFEYGTPPGGIVQEIDRICMLLADGTEYPGGYCFFKKIKMPRDVMASAPSAADNKQLKDLHIKIDQNNPLDVKVTFQIKKISNSIDINTVHYIANLITIKIDDEEAKVFSQQFSQIIEYFQKLTKFETEEVQLANENWAMSNIFRDDVIRSSMSCYEFLNNTPHHDGYFVRVPGVFDDR